MCAFILFILVLAVPGLHCYVGFSLLASRGCVWLWCVGFSQGWLLLLWHTGSGACEQGLRLAVACGLLAGVASPSVTHRLRRMRYSVVLAQGLSGCSSLALEHRLSNSGKWASSLLGMWDLCRPRIEPVSPALAGVQHLLKQILSCHDNRISAFVIVNMLVV